MSAEGGGDGGRREEEVVIEMSTSTAPVAGKRSSDPPAPRHLNLKDLGIAGLSKEPTGATLTKEGSFNRPATTRRGSVRRRSSQEERERIGELVRRRSSQGDRLSELLGTPLGDDFMPLSKHSTLTPSTALAAKLHTPGTMRTATTAATASGGGAMSKASKAKKPTSYPKNWPHPSDADLKERPRRVFVNEEQDYSFVSNLIITSKYTALSFLPLFLFASFNPKKKMANVYFLLLAIFQCVPAISNTFGVPTVLLPLSIVIIIDGIFAALEDIRRHKADKAANCSPTKLWDPATQSFVSKTWVDIQVGDFIMIENYGVVPADVVLLSVHEPEPEQPDGICYLETKSLDGETNLKIRQTIQTTLGKIKEPKDIAPFKGLVEMEHPNKMIDSFEGTIEIFNENTRILRKEVIQHLNVLLRGCVVRNTQWVLGLVVNTGRDTKIMMSSIDPPPKSSVMTLAINVEIRRIVMLLVAVCVIGATGYVIMARLDREAFSYLMYPPAVLNGDMDMALADWIIQFAYLMLLLGNFIPVSLYVSMSTIRFFQAIFMEWDRHMYHEPVDHHCEVRTMNLNEELGQVSHVFTDKTGTLTCNIMEFRKCSINGFSYGLGVTEISKSYRRMSGMTFSPDELRIEHESRKASAPHVNFYDPIFWDDLNKARRGETQKRRIEDFFRLLSVCHSVTPEKDEKTGEIKFSASSPDDEALVCAAKYFGFRFEGRRDGAAQIRTNHGMENFKVLEVLEFTSARKRMSVIVERDDGRVQLLAKGADTAMIARLRKGQEVLVETTMEHMKRFATEGLRTLMICVATVSKEHFYRWYHKWEKATKDLEQIGRRKRGEPNDIDRLMEEIERDFELMGATAIEDKLQEGVPETIFDLSRAGIKVWMLTGDKEETATNIGVACNLLEHHSKMRRITINTEKCSNEAQIRYVLKEELKKYKEDWEKHGDHTRPRALIIDGASLITASGDKVLRRLVKLTKICKAVIACRVSPDQKRSIVEMVVSNDPHVRALSIGDGANDVPMIQKAHIGVGIAGQEGMQAVNASDYAIAQFRFLAPLLLAHGRWNYQRMAFVVTYIFYKNILEAVSMFFFAFCNAFSGQKLFTEGSIQLYNVLFTTAPLLLYGMWDRDVTYEHALKYPQLYIPGIRGKSFTFDHFWRWILVALVEAVLATIYPLYALRTATVEKSVMSTFWEAGAVTFTTIILIVNFKIAMRQQRWSVYNVLVWLLTVALWFVAGFAISSLLAVDHNWFHLFPNVMSSPGCWLVIIIIVVTLQAADVLVLGWRRAFSPDLVHVIQAMETGLRSEADMSKAIEALQVTELKSIAQGMPAVSPANATPIEAAVRSMFLEGTMRARKTAGFAFSADPITLEAERRRIMYNTARMGVLKDILEELELGDESEFPDEFDRPDLDPDDSIALAAGQQPGNSGGDTDDDQDSSGPSPVMEEGPTRSTRTAALRLLEAASARFHSPFTLGEATPNTRPPQPQPQAAVAASTEDAPQPPMPGAGGGEATARGPGLGSSSTGTGPPPPPRDHDEEEAGHGGAASGGDTPASGLSPASVLPGADSRGHLA